MRLFTAKPGPQETRDFKRIIQLPQRNAEELGEAICEPLSDMYRTPNGKMTLRPLQALALAEACDLDGAVVLLPVGQGKTLVSFLLPTIMEAKKPLLIVPGKLYHKTQVEFLQLENDWVRPKNLVITTYERISTQPELLNNLEPDLIIADESHKLKNKKAACTKRIWKYWHDNEIKFVPMSGTLAKRSFFDWWHLQLMALPEALCVLPFQWNEAELWSCALDEKTKNRVGLGALKYFGDNLQKAREGYGKLLKKVPGIIASDTVNVASSLTIEVLNVKIKSVDEAIDKLNNTWTLPDGTEISEATDFWRHSREIANGFYYRWKKEPPPYWLEARRNFNSKIREVLKNSRKWTAPAEVVKALRGDPIVEAWFDTKDLFKPENEAVWFTNEVIEKALEIADKNPGLIWYEHRAVGERLSGYLPTFANQGRNTKTGQSIIDYRGESAAVSVAALGEGFNLQKWDRNIILNCTPTGTVWEQMLGRTHRPGQEADTVEVEILTTTHVQRNDFKQARADAKYIEATTGQKQKLSFADIISEDENETE